MSKELKDIELRSEEINEILTRVPNWMIRSGNTLFLSLILMLLILSWIIKYPDVVTSEIMITTEIKSQSGVAKINGRLDSIFVIKNQPVKKNQILGTVENTSDFSDVLFLKSILDTIKFHDQSFSFPIDQLPILILGDIENSYKLFENNYIQYILEKNNLPFNGYQNKKPLNDTEISQIVKKRNLLKNTILSFNQLKITVDNWENNYILKSELEGNVYFQNDWSNNQSVNKGDLLFIITPVKNSRYIANLKIGSQDIRKVKVGQQVNIQLDSYPDYEYGVLQGTVKTISSISNRNGFYLIDVSLPKKLITSNNTIINFKEELSGKAEIITADIRLIERFFISLNKL